MNSNATPKASFFRLSLCKPVELNDDGSIAVNYDWRDYTYTIVENLDGVDLNKQYMCFVEDFHLNNYDNEIGDGDSIRNSFRVETPDLYDALHYHSTDEKSYNTVLIQGNVSQYKQVVGKDDLGIVCNVDFIRRKKIRVLITQLYGATFKSETNPDQLLVNEGLTDKTYYRMTLLFKEI